MRQKLARLSAALAARLFSTYDYTNLTIERHHVEYIAKFIDDTYSANSFGYRRYSAAMQSRNTLKDPHDIRSAVCGLVYAGDFIEKVLEKVCIDVNDVMDLGGVEFAEAKTLIGLFVRKGALHRAGKGNTYLKSPPFIELLRELQLKVQALPDHLSSTQASSVVQSSVSTSVSQSIAESM